MAYDEPARYREHGIALGWRSYLNAADLREITRIRRTGSRGQ